MASHASIEIDSDQKVLSLKGQWTLGHLAKAAEDANRYKDLPYNELIIDAKHIHQLDSSGALIINDLVGALRNTGTKCNLQLGTDDQRSLIDYVGNKSKGLDLTGKVRDKEPWLHFIGREVSLLFVGSCNFLAFVGEVFITFVAGGFRPKRWHWRTIAEEIQSAGFNALVIVAVLSMLIGVVVAYQLSRQLVKYGANIYIVDFTGIAILREFGPLVTAILAAARTSTSFAALIGTMKMNEEIDAMKTMGLSPMERLVLPRIAALVIVLPLLTVWAEMWGVFGGMLMANNSLGVKFGMFLERFRENVAIEHYVFGLIKTPVFALIISSVGCYQGFKSGYGAQAIGKHTTMAVVQALFMIIAADACFSVIFTEFDI